MTDSFAGKYKKSHISRSRLSVILFTIFLSILSYPAVASAVLDITLEWDASSSADGYRLFHREDGQN